MYRNTIATTITPNSRQELATPITVLRYQQIVFCMCTYVLFTTKLLSQGCPNGCIGLLTSMSATWTNTEENGAQLGHYQKPIPINTIRTMLQFILKYVSSPIISFCNNWFLCNLLIARIIVIMLLVVTGYELAMDSLKRGLCFPMYGGHNGVWDSE